MENITIDQFELDKINMIRFIFSIYKTDKLEINEILNILNSEILPTELKTDNNMVYIRDLVNYLVLNNLKPNIIEKQ